MSHYYTDYAHLIIDKHGKTKMAELSAQALEDLVASELAAFCPERQEVVGVAVEVGVLVGDMAAPVMPMRRRGRDAMFR
jgi:Flp pilus assembly CpaE family ATPase